MRERIDQELMMEEYRTEQQEKMVAAYRDSAEMDLTEKLEKDTGLMRELLIDAIAEMSEEDFAEALVTANRDSRLFGDALGNAFNKKVEEYTHTEESLEWIRERAIELAQADGWGE